MSMMVNLSVLLFGSFLPDNVVTLIQRKWSIQVTNGSKKRTGIEERRIAPEGYEYILWQLKPQKALQMAKLDVENINDMIIFATLTPDMVIPSAACMLQANLGAKMQQLMITSCMLRICVSG